MCGHKRILKFDKSVEKRWLIKKCIELISKLNNYFFLLIVINLENSLNKMEKKYKLKKKKLLVLAV